MRLGMFIAASVVLSAMGMGMAQEAKPAKGTLRVTVPPTAKLMVEDVVTASTGPVRRFETPELAPLEAGKKYVYKIKISYIENGKNLVKETEVKIEPGKETEVDLTKADIPAREEAAAKVDDASKPAPKPEDKPKKDEPKKEIKVDIEVPYVPTPEKVVEEMLKTAKVKAGEVVYDLGCGDGRIVVTAVKQFKAKRGLGIDFNPERIKDSEETAKKAGVEKQVTFKQGDVLKLTEKDFADVDVVTLYLLPEVNRRLKPILLKGLKPGARVVSHDFDMGDDWKPEETKKLDVDGIEHTVYLWTIKEKK